MQASTNLLHKLEILRHMQEQYMRRVLTAHRRGRRDVAQRCADHARITRCAENALKAQIGGRVA